MVIRIKIALQLWAILVICREVGKHNYWLCLTFNKELTNIQELIYVNGNTFESIKFSW